jgi:hypothetical protein
MQPSLNEVYTEATDIENCRWTVDATVTPGVLQVDLWWPLGKYGKTMTWGFSQGKADGGFGLVESCGCILCQAAMTNAKNSSPRDATSNIP